MSSKVTKYPAALMHYDPFVGNGKIGMSLKPTGLMRDPTLLFSSNRFLIPPGHQAALF